MKKFIKKPVGICIHHSLTKDGIIADALGIKYYHTHPALNGVTITKEKYLELKAKGVPGLKEAWSDVGYHGICERVNGTMIYIPGRDFKYQGAHCPELNATHLGICLVGNFDIAPPDKEQLDFLTAIAVKIMTEQGMNLNRVEYHTDHSTKTCPGKFFPKDGFRLAVAGETRPIRKDIV